MARIRSTSDPTGPPFWVSGAAPPPALPRPPVPTSITMSAGVMASAICRTGQRGSENSVTLAQQNGRWPRRLPLAGLGDRHRRQSGTRAGRSTTSDRPRGRPGPVSWRWLHSRWDGLERHGAYGTAGLAENGGGGRRLRSRQIGGAARCGEEGGGRGEGRCDVTLRERRTAFDGGVEGRPERPEVGWRARWIAADELGGHVWRRTDDVAVPAGRVGRLAAVGLGDPEVDQHHPAVGAEQQVRRFDVAVHDAGRVHRA